MSWYASEIFRADDLILMSENEKSLCEIVQWISGLEANGKKMNTGKTKVIFGCNVKDRMERKVSGSVVYVRRELAIIRFCVTVA